ncbi:MAG: hypothetical protein ACFFFC_01550 [Candidatus Thorarchaeota archaeon]
MTNIDVKALGVIGVVLVMTTVNMAGAANSPLTNSSIKLALPESKILGTLLVDDSNPRIAVVKPIFTDTAYSSAFYNFYSKYAGYTDYIDTDLHLLNVTVKDGWGWSLGLSNFLTSFKARVAGLSLGENVKQIDEIDVTMGALFENNSRVYDVVILGFTEYVTIEEYNFYKRFVETGGTLIIMDACNFLAEVKYCPPASPDEAGYLSLVKGHGWEFNGTYAWKSVYHRWPEENRNWIASNYWRWWTGDHYDYFQSNTSHPISAYIRNNYGQNVTSRYGAHEENTLENFTDTQVIGYWHFIDPDEEPNDPVVAYQHKYGEGSVFHAGIMASDVVAREEFLQAFLVSAVRMAIMGDVGVWSFNNDYPFQFLTSAFYENGTQVEQGARLSGKVKFFVNFSTSIIVQDQRYYSLEWVGILIDPQDSSGLSSPLASNGSMIDENPRIWRIDVDTWDLYDGEYVFKVCCRFISNSNASDYLDSTLMVSVHEVKNIPDEIRTSLYAVSGSLVAIVAFVSLVIVWSDSRKQTGGL